MNTTYGQQAGYGRIPDYGAGFLDLWKNPQQGPLDALVPDFLQPGSDSKNEQSGFVDWLVPDWTQPKHPGPSNSGSSGSDKTVTKPPVSTKPLYYFPKASIERLTAPGPGTIGTASAATIWPPRGAIGPQVYVGPLGPPAGVPSSAGIGLGTTVAIGLGVLALVGAGGYALTRKQRRR